MILRRNSMVRIEFVHTRCTRRIQVDRHDVVLRNRCACRTDDQYLFLFIILITNIITHAPMTQRRRL